ncbi:DNA mismatch repair protein MutT [Deinococcus arenae]|uniref:DNA mismatch repair protein MutT n=1 Tax=Deinococcus arenae TaxID=1452751 RepID=A0A8H9GR01_9DEIO|nr:DNA mismatch repair protein MutT [Deinococcus actinosclerus]GGM51202.1 DNA mismatch repair protein MutT [Deinococcus arenae]
MDGVTYVRELRARTGPLPLILSGACALLLRGEAVLLQRRRDTGGWGTPGGLCEPGESLEDTLRREVHEETGLSVLDPLLFTVVSGAGTFVRLPNGDEFYQVSAAYVVRRWEGVPRPDGTEGSELAFWPLDALPDGLGPVDRAALARLRVCVGMS